MLTQRRLVPHTGHGCQRVHQRRGVDDRATFHAAESTQRAHHELLRHRIRSLHDPGLILRH